MVMETGNVQYATYGCSLGMAEQGRGCIAVLTNAIMFSER
jgi:hypothetical protein